MASFCCWPTPKNSPKLQKLNLISKNANVQLYTLSLLISSAEVISLSTPAYLDWSPRDVVVGLEGKFVEVAHQEPELVALLKKLPLGQSELVILRERAIQLKEGTLKSRGEALLPMMLSSFIFDSLVLSQLSSSSRDSRDRHSSVYR